MKNTNYEIKEREEKKKKVILNPGQVTPKVTLGTPQDITGP